MSGKKRPVRVGGYLRLSREDGDKAESDSIANQRKILTSYCQSHPELRLVELYIDDGCTGTHFDRPAFRRMERDWEQGKINCVLVKDLSRFGRDYIEAGRYLERVFPEREIRFISVADQFDSDRDRCDMILSIKNVFHANYARDISQKVRGAMEAKQRSGEFVGAFASYGYCKDPENHNHLVVDPAAAEVVRRIYRLYEGGMGQIRIAKLLNQEGVPCPSEYKRLQGQRYSNSNRLDKTNYWTYPTIHRLLMNRMYVGDLVQGKHRRVMMHGRAKAQTPDQWIVVEGTHEGIIDRAQWERVQELLRRRTRTPELGSNVGLFAGFLRCGDCGRAMCKTSGKGGITYCCGSYKRYGAGICSPHTIAQQTLERAVLEAVNQLLAGCGDLNRLAEEVIREQSCRRDVTEERKNLRHRIAERERRKKQCYEDYCDGLLSREDFLTYRKEYEGEIAGLQSQLEQLDGDPQQEEAHPWIRALVEDRRITALDRGIVQAVLSEVVVYQDRRVEIRYAFAER